MDGWIIDSFNSGPTCSIVFSSVSGMGDAVFCPTVITRMCG